MDLGDFETVIKVIVVGNGGVGKSSMTARYCKGIFTDSYKKTIGVDYLEKTIELGVGESVKLMVWDTAGQEEFDAITSSYYRGAGACAIVFATNDRASFDALDKWRKKVSEECHSGLVTALVQNKIDLAAEAKMTDEEVAAVAARWGVPLFKACVKDDVNVVQVFEHLASQYILKGTNAGGAAAVQGMGTFAEQGGASAPAEAPAPASPESAAASPAGAASSDARRSATTTPASAGATTARTPREESVIIAEEETPVVAAGAGAPVASMRGGSSDANALPPPPTNQAFKLTAETKIQKKKRGWC